MADTFNKQQLWQSRIEECQNSSMSARQWCQEHQIAYSTYSYWARKIRLEADPDKKSFPEEPVFIKLPSQQEILNVSKRTEAPVSMFLGKIRIEISPDCSKTLLQSFVDAFIHYA